MNSKDYVVELLETAFGVGVPMSSEDGESIMMDPFNPKKTDKINKAEHYDSEWPLKWDNEDRQSTKDQTKKSKLLDEV